MDPFTIAALGSAGLGVGQAIAQALPNKAKKHNRKRIEQLERERGLSSQQKDALHRSAMDPVKAAAAESRRRAEAMQAGMGGSAAASDLARLRSEQSATIAEGGQRAAQEISELDIQQERRDEQELEQRLQAQAAGRQENVGNIMGSLSQAAGIAGMAAGGPPSIQLGGLFGMRVKDPDKSLAKLREKGVTDPSILSAIRPMLEDGTFAEEATRALEGDMSVNPAILEMFYSTGQLQRPAAPAPPPAPTAATVPTTQPGVAGELFPGEMEMMRQLGIPPEYL